MSRFLRFVVEETLTGRENELKESLIGVTVFGRKPGFDPQQDSTVRSEAARLRSRLAEYYANEGKLDTLVIELPKGGYVPRFREAVAPPATRAQVRTPRWRHAILGALAASLTILAAGFGWHMAHKAEPISIAVLPLTNVSDDAANDYLADGLTNEIIWNLSMIDRLAVRSQTSSFALKGKSRNIHDAGKLLSVEYILEGAVMRTGNQMRINVQLVRVRDDFPVWSRRYDSEISQVLSVQDEISRSIVNNLRLTLGSGRRRYETNAEAYDLYLRAVAAANTLFPGDVEVIHRFEQVISKDGLFAPAYSGLAMAQTWRSFRSARGPDHEEATQAMRPAAERALALDPLLPEAHSAWGAVQACEGKWKQAEESFRKAIAINPNLSSAHQSFARFVLLPLGRIDEAVREMRTAEKNDPLSPLLHYELSVALLSARRPDEAVQQCAAMGDVAAKRDECLGRARLAQGKTDEAIQVLSSKQTDNWGYLANAYASARRWAEAGELVSEGFRTRPKGGFQFALAFAGYRDKDRTIEYLERMAGVGPVRIGFTLNEPEFAFLRRDSRVQALRKKVGLP